MKDFFKFLFKLIAYFICVVCLYAAAFYQAMESIVEKLFPNISEDKKANLAEFLYIAFDIVMIIILLHIINYLDILLYNIKTYGSFYKLYYIKSGSLF